jgi:hypothetical protein
MREMPLLPLAAKDADIKVEAIILSLPVYDYQGRRFMGKWSYEAATAAMVGAGAIAMSLFMWSVGPSTSMIGRAIYWQN